MFNKLDVNLFKEVIVKLFNFLACQRPTFPGLSAADFS